MFTHTPIIADCPICNGRRPYVQTNAGKFVGRRCLICAGTLAHQATYRAIQDIFGCDLERLDTAYELSAHGALWRTLQRRLGKRLTCSEYLEASTLGRMHDGVRCENVEALTFLDDSFDLVTSTGMFEHVEDDLCGYREICRVLKPGGYTVFYVPYGETRAQTRVRAKRCADGAIEHFLPAAYHSDPIRGENAVFVWRDYGRDIVGTLARAGLNAEVQSVPICGQSVPVIVGRKPAD